MQDGIINCLTRARQRFTLISPSKMWGLVRPPQRATVAVLADDWRGEDRVPREAREGFAHIAPRVYRSFDTELWVLLAVAAKVFSFVN